MASKNKNLFFERFSQEKIIFENKVDVKNDKKMITGSIFLTNNYIVVINSKKDYVHNITWSNVESVVKKSSILSNKAVIIYDDTTLELSFTTSDPVNVIWALWSVKKDLRDAQKLEKELKSLRFTIECQDRKIEKLENIIDEHEKNMSDNATGTLLDNKSGEHLKSEFTVVGYRQNNSLKKVYTKKVNEILQSRERTKYKDLKGFELREEIEDWGKVYKFWPFQTNKVELVQEPDNIYDSNAVAVYLKGDKVGYIKSEETTQVLEYFKNRKPIAKFLSGPYKYIDEYEDTIKTANNMFVMKIIT
ncbi:HIRAN domain-containing protein [Staphylococcus delphini]|uniref:HIRAN domain-containing protein n=1 Tax=Staphylococcus delphini TaxID=53344 RepID=UPI000BBB804A|nr:HIRAN domain-containing protein [Staphylococcus delphini]PCF72809.1 hypothetical protein B4W71_08280 [Staphylococcus delphini]